MNKLLIYTYADKMYYKFVVPFIYFATQSNIDCKIEIILEDKNFFINEYRESINQLKKITTRFILSQSKFQGVLPNSIRFIQQPEIESLYIYMRYRYFNLR